MRRGLVALLIGLGLAVGACTGSSATPMAESSFTVPPTSTTSSSPDPSTEGSPTTGQPVTGPLARFNPCHLITKADGAQFGIQHARRDDKYGLRSCRYIGPEVLIGVTLFDDQRLADYHTRLAQGAPVKTAVRGYPAQLQRLHGGECDVIFSVSPTASVDVGGIDSGGDQETSCAIAKKAASIVADAIFGQ